MQAYSVEKVVTQDGKILLDTVPFLAGETVQVIVLPSKRARQQPHTHSLKDSVVAYVAPLEPVAQNDWAALQ